METKLKLFNEKTVRTVWNADEEEWYFSVVDVVEVLTDSANPTDYLKKMRKRDNELAAFLGTNCPQVEMIGETGKKRKVLAATTKGVLRLIQSIPSPKAEPFKIWLAQVGAERLDEIADPEKAIQRGTAYYREKGYSDEWINQRLRTIEVRKKLTDEWSARGVDADFDTEFLDYILAIKIVDNVEEAVSHIAAHSTGHSEAILTRDEAHAALFTAAVDSAAVYVNCSTRFTDGGEFGLGCEMGISTQKLHARGPMGLEELCSYKYIIHGSGQIR